MQDLHDIPPHSGPTDAAPPSFALPRKVYLETFGCQMNELDSELVQGHLAALGYRFVTESDQADVVLYNTCSVREQAEQKVLSRVGIMGKRKREDGRRFVLGVIGCMAEREGPNMMRRFPQIDLMCGPGELDKLPMLIDNALRTSAADEVDRSEVIEHQTALQGNTNRRTATLAAATDNLEMLDLSRAFDPDRTENAANGGGRSAYVRITRGCNKFCTYCVVPFTRGAEVHRPPQAIIDECKRLADAGVIEITLLGQTVNHYHYVHGAAVSGAGIELPQIGGKSGGKVGGKGVGGNGGSAKPQAAAGIVVKTTSFADLLRRIHDEVPSLRRLRFVTSYPRDFGDDALQVMRDSPRICRYLHVPAQSGSNRILQAMNRGYTVEQYLEFIARAREIMPDVSIAGDIIVGFPTETDADFELTKDLLRRVPFKNNYIFKYSPRPGTVAIDRFADDVGDDVKRARNNELLALQTEVSAAAHRSWVGRDVEVFVERVSRTSQRKAGASAGGMGGVELRWEKRGNEATADDRNTQMSGRTGGDLIAVFDLPREIPPAEVIGRIVAVHVTGSGPLILHGKVIHNVQIANQHGASQWEGCTVGAQPSMVDSRQ